ncbi:hypothetical protein [uncultured Actinomyces sp.]|jgi:hypothetical protein avisC_00977|uniref:hypothetical protein n=1 Tax=uncultured Actinomyces sp. TaxID=249061 RepID=UPI0028D3BC3A|nr:hypothetical protein [uncultured Actinomyces sp.]
MTKHVSSSGDDNAQTSLHDAATESLPTRDSTDDGTQILSQGAVGGDAAEFVTQGIAADSAKESAVESASEAEKGSQDSDDRGNQTATDASANVARAAVAGSSTADTRLGGSWISPDVQNAATIGVAGSVSDTVKKTRAKVRGPWYRRRVVVGAAGAALLAGTFAAGWGANELLDHDGDARVSHAQQESGNGQGVPGGQGGPGGQGAPGGQMPGGGPGGGQGGPGSQGRQGGPGGGSGGAGRTTPDGEASGGSGTGDGNQKGGSGSSSGVLQQQDAAPSTQG